MHLISRRTRPIGSRGVVDVLTVIKTKAAASRIKAARVRAKAKADRVAGKTATTATTVTADSAETMSLLALWTIVIATRVTAEV